MAKELYTDEELVKAIRSGETELYSIVVKRNKESVLKGCLVMLKDENSAQEIAQKVFIKFYEKIDQFEGRASLKTYLGKIAMNLCLNELKRLKREQNRTSNFEESTRHFSYRNDSYELRDTLHTAMQLLSIDHRAIITLRMLQGYSTKECADTLEISQGTVMSRLSRAMKALKLSLEKIGYEHG